MVRTSEFPVMTVEEVCTYLRIHRSTMYRLLKNGLIPAFKMGSDWRFNREAIDQWRFTRANGLPQERPA